MLSAEMYHRYKQPLTHEKMESCKLVINRMVDIVGIVRSYGILALENEANDEPSGLLKIGMLLLVDAVEPERVENILLRIFYADTSEHDAMEKLLMIDGLLMLQNGVNPKVLGEALYAVLGEKEILAYEDTYTYITYFEKCQRHCKFMESIESQQSLPECDDFDNTFRQLGGMAIQYVIRELAHFPTLTVALKGCSFRGVREFLRNLSQRRVLELIDEWERCSPRKSDILDAQKRIMDTLLRLESQGEIIISREEPNERGDSV